MQPFTATVPGSPRIGAAPRAQARDRGYWAGRTSRSDLESVAATLRRDTWEALARRRPDSGTGEHLLLLRPGARHRGHARRRCPRGAAQVPDELDRYFAAARGNEDVAPLEMTKWFDTNYHYLVPEIGPATDVHAEPGQGALRDRRGARTRHSGRGRSSSGRYLPAAEQGRHGGGAAARAAAGAGADLLRAAARCCADTAPSGCSSTSPRWSTDICPDAPALAEAASTTRWAR